MSGLYPYRVEQRGQLALPLQYGVRIHPQHENDNRTCYARDRDRIIHSNVFRRLKHKTQVFVAPKGDHFRTRMTHSLEVAQIARAIARNLGADEDLTEAIALAHDIGHPPFGHVGEFALNKSLEQYGGFDHNHQTLRNLMVVEDRYHDCRGLNLTIPTLLGLVQHHGKLQPDEKIAPCAVGIFDLPQFKRTHSPSLEAQIAAEADDIAYNAHDIDDGLRANILTLELLYSQDWCRDELQNIHAQYPNIAERYIITMLVRNLITAMISDLYQTTIGNIEYHKIQNAMDIIECGQNIVAYSPQMREKIQKLKKFLYDNLYFSQILADERKIAFDCVSFLCGYYLNDQKTFPTNGKKMGEPERINKISDYIAGMTDHYALNLANEFQKNK